MQAVSEYQPRVKQLLEALEVSLHVEFGSVQMSAQDLLNLHHGQVIPLQFDPEQIVTLLLDRQEIARAKLRATGEGLALEIQELVS